MRSCTWPNVPGHEGADGEQHRADGEVAGALGGDPEDDDEQGEEQQGRAEVLLADHDDQGAAHAIEERAEVRGSGRWNGPTFQVPAASSSRRSVR